MKEWLCLTCQTQRALSATELAQPPLMKPTKASPSKVPQPLSSQKDATENQKKVISNEKVGTVEKILDSAAEIQTKMDITKTTTASPAVKDTTAAASGPTKDEKSSLPPAEDVPTTSAPQSKDMEPVVSDDRKTMAAQAPSVIDAKTSKDKENPPIIDPSKVESEMKEETAVAVEKSADQTVKSLDEVQPQQALNKDSQPVESGPTPAQSEHQGSGSFFGFGSPKSQHAGSNKTEMVTGKMMGFGSSLFSSATSLITSAVQEDTRTMSSSRKMSAPQVSGKTSELQMSPKSSSQVFSRKMSEVKANDTQKAHLVKKPDQPKEIKATPPGKSSTDRDSTNLEKPEVSQAAPKVGHSICPLCKVELNMDSKTPTNFNTCTDCKSTVCNKCGFSPMPNLTQVIKLQQKKLIQIILQQILPFCPILLFSIQPSKSMNLFFY